jgi:hypothetical protein
MKPAASLSAKLIVRKGLATPSNLTRQFALDDPPDLPDAVSAETSGFKSHPIINTLDGDFYGSDHVSQIPEAKLQQVCSVENRQTDPLKPEEPRQAPAPRPTVGMVTIISKNLPRRPIGKPDTPIRHQVKQDSRPARRPMGAGPRIAMTVRLNHDQHRELHDFADSRGRTCQDVFVRAVETYMAIYR